MARKLEAKRKHFCRAILSAMRLLVFCTFLQFSSALNNCPTSSIRAVIERAAETTVDPVIQIQMVRRILEDVYGGTWGVLVIRNPALVSKEVHWTFPDHSNEDGSPAFCLTVINGIQYNVFKTGAVDSTNRVTVEDLIQNVHKARHSDEKPLPRRFTVRELDRVLASAIQGDGVVFRSRVNRSPRLVY
ncbi:unnamed protein product [Caenorhabditis auriculariae]|uniref:Uncharacterized protein n=1 Tax=Caenorhabditis auriculariae TaxID=2777116 RepID=A0A8S1H0V3_9PELO|nr:unnamed protein product [Caenorhabditis auriculariae]